MLDALAGWLADVLLGALNLLPTWNLSPGSFPFFSQLGQISWFVNLSPAFGVTVAALALGPMFLTTTLTLWVYAVVRGGGNRA